MDSNKILHVAKNEYMRWMHNPKLIIFFVMLIFVYDYVILELTTAADRMGKDLQVFEGFIGVSNSQLLLMIIPIIFVGLMGDFPRISGNAMFYIYRVGKINWLMGQILFAIMTVVTYLSALLGFSIIAILSRSFLNNIWSEITTRYYIFAPNEYASIVANLTTGRLYNNLLPLEATLHILGLMFLFLLLISMMLLVGFLCRARMAGVVVTTGILCVGNVLAYMENSVRWFFPTAHAVLEIHFDEIYQKPIMDMRLSYLYYTLLLCVLLIVAFLSIERCDFSKIEELEE